MTATRLTDHDREILAKARALSMLPGMASIREHTGEADNTDALVAVVGEAKWLLADLVACVTRLDEELASRDALAEAEVDAEAWGGKGPSASYAEWLAEGLEGGADG